MLALVNPRTNRHTDRIVWLLLFSMLGNGNGYPDPDSDQKPGTSYLPPTNGNGLSSMYGAPNGNGNGNGYANGNGTKKNII